MTLSNIDYAIILGYFLVVFFVHIIFKASKPKAKENLESYFLAGRKLTLPLFIATLVSTWYGNLLGISEIAFKHGLVAWLTQGIFWYVIYFFFVYFLVEKIHSSKLFSIPDQLERIYDRKTAVLGAVVNLFMINPAVYILSIGLICHLIFGVDKVTGVLIGTLVPLFYTFKGGFKAVVYTDLIQFIFMFVGVALVLPFAYLKFGGVEFLTANVPESHFSLGGDWSWQLLLAWFLIAMWTLVDPGFYQRTYAASDAKTAKRGILLATLFWFIFDMLVNLIGLYAFAAMPGADPALSMPILANDVLPSIAKGIFFTGLIATIMSTLDSLSFSSAMSISYDIYRRLNPKVKQAKVILVNKIALVVTVGLGLLVAIYFESLVDLMYTRGTIAVSALLVPLMASYFIKKPSARSAFTSIIVGILMAILAYVLKHYSITDIEPLFLGLLGSSLTFYMLK